MRILITGGAGFIGSHMVKHMLEQGHQVCVADRFTYAGKGRNLHGLNCHIMYGDLADGDLATRCAAWQPEWVIHMAAETHVDRAIESPDIFMRSNVLGTTNLLQNLWLGDAIALQKVVVYSTDEVFGPTPKGIYFDESAPMNPSNAYSASKVGVEAVARCFFTTHRMPICVVRPCNTYGPRQHPEKVIPKFVNQMLNGEEVTVYNDGNGSRDWLHVEDHARATETVLKYGIPGESYNFAANEEHTDREIAELIEKHLSVAGARVTYVPGRPGHDRRYALNGSKLHRLGWRPEVNFDDGFKQTVLWNATHWDWWQHDLVRA